MKLDPCFERLSISNPVLSNFLDFLRFEKNLSASKLRLISSSVERLIALHGKEAKGFFRQMDRTMPQDSYRFWEQFGSVSVKELEADEAAVNGCFSGFFFPGRSKYRKDFLFDKSEKFDCNKLYVASKKFSPGVLTIQCCCETPQLLGYVVMIRAESTSLALNSMLTHFQIPPRVVYYDNACNLAKSVMLRAPWLLHLSKFIVDRFHYKGHTCCELYDAESYDCMDVDRTTTAESFNARLEKSVPYLRFVKAENLIPQLNIRFALLNIASRYRRRFRTDDLEDCDLWEFFRETVPCLCEGCCHEAIDAMEKRDSTYYGIQVPDAASSSSSDYADEHAELEGQAQDLTASQSPMARASSVADAPIVDLLEFSTDEEVDHDIQAEPTEN